MVIVGITSLVVHPHAASVVHRGTMVTTGGGRYGPANLHVTIVRAMNSVLALQATIGRAVTTLVCYHLLP